MSNVINVGFIGNPNCGKTTLFNAFTGANLKVANWPGVTVEKKEGTAYYQGQEFRLIDLPGIYSLTSYSMEETVSRECIMSDEVDVIVDVIDASSLERNLYLTLQLLELGKPVVLALNMMDIVEERGMEIDLHRLPEMLGVPAIPVSARKKTGLSILMHAVAHHKELASQGPLIHHHPGLHTSHRHDHHAEYAMVYHDEIEDKIDAIIVQLTKKYPEMENKRWYAIKFLEADQNVISQYPVDLSGITDRSYEKEIINQKYDFIEEVIGEVLVNKSQKAAFTDKVDHFLTHRFLGLFPDLRHRRLAKRIFRACAGNVFRLRRRFSFWSPCKCHASVSDSGRCDIRCRRNPDIPSEYLYPVSGTRYPGGQRIYVKSCFCHGRHHE